MALEDAGHTGSPAIEGRADNGFFSSEANHLARSALAQKQSQRVDENGLARTGFAGKQAQSRRKIDGHVIDDSIVFDTKLEQQSAVLCAVQAQHNIRLARSNKVKIGGKKRATF